MNVFESPVPLFNNLYIYIYIYIYIYADLTIATFENKERIIFVSKILLKSICVCVCVEEPFGASC